MAIRFFGIFCQKNDASFAELHSGEPKVHQSVGVRTLRTPFSARSEGSDGPWPLTLPSSSHYEAFDGPCPLTPPLLHPIMKAYDGPWPLTPPSSSYYESL